MASARLAIQWMDGQLMLTTENSTEYVILSHISSEYHGRITVYTQVNIVVYYFVVIFVILYYIVVSVVSIM